MQGHIAAGKLPRQPLVLVLACAVALLGAAAAPAFGGEAHHRAGAARCLRGHAHRRHRRCRRAHHPAQHPAAGGHPAITPSQPAAGAVQPSPPPAPSAPPAVPAPCANTDLTPAPGNIAQITAATLCLINQQRSENGRSPLTDNRLLDQSAQQHSQDMVASDYFDHTGPSGETFDARIMSTGYVPADWTYYMLAENIAVGTGEQATPAAIVNGWMSDPEHRANILGDFHDSGIGVAAATPPSVAGGGAGATYTQDFGLVTTS